MTWPLIKWDNEAVNRQLRTFIDQRGLAFPITTWLDDDGEECDPIEATRAVAGEGRRWYVLDLREFTEKPQ